MKVFPIGMAVLGLALLGMSPTNADELEPFAHFARALVANFNHQKSTVFDHSLDTDAFIDIIEHNAPEKRGLGKNTLLGLRVGLHELGRQLLTTAGKNARWRFVRAYGGTASRAQALIRIDLGDDGLVYLRFQLRQSGVNVRIVDWYSYTNAQYATETLGNAMKIYSSSRNPVERVALKRFLRARRRGDTAKARAIYDGFPVSARRNPRLLTVLIQAAQGDETTYRHVLADLATAAGDDARYAMLLAGHYADEENFKAALREIDKFALLVGDDGALQSLRANLCNLMGQQREALSHYRHALELEPDYEDTYTGLLDVLVETRHYAEAVSVLRILSGRFDYQFTPKTLADTKGYEGFRASAEYQAWLGEL